MTDNSPLDSRSVADAIAAGKPAPPPSTGPHPIPPVEPEPEPSLEPTPWAPEEWRAGKFLVTRHVPIPGSPQLRREVYGSGKLGNYATPFESEESAQAQADKLNEGD